MTLFDIFIKFNNFFAEFEYAFQIVIYYVLTFFENLIKLNIIKFKSKKFDLNFILDLLFVFIGFIFLFIFIFYVTLIRILIVIIPCTIKGFYTIFYFLIPLKYLDYLFFNFKLNINFLKDFCIFVFISWLVILLLKYNIKIIPRYLVSSEVIYSMVPFIKYLSIPILALIHISIINKNNTLMLKQASIFWSFILLLFLLYISYLGYYCDAYIFEGKNVYFLYTYFKINKFVILYSIDHMALLFLYLTSLLFFIIFIYLNDIKEYKKVLLILYIIYFFLINIFSTQNLLVFFFFFESIVYPMFYLIIMGGSRNQKIKAAYYFFFFTVIGSLFLFLSINYLIINYKYVNINVLLTKIHTLDFEIQKWLWLSFFLSFAIKIPMFPFHTWLPEAHVEAPTYGSVLLAGVLLKLGVYGMLRILFLLFPQVNYYFADYVIILALISIFYSSIIAIRQTDIKRIVAYASIAHMNIIVIGLYSYEKLSIYGALFQSFSHGFVATGLFIIIGILYDRYKTRNYYYYGGLAMSMPLFSIFYLLLTLANFSFPLTSNFIGELFIFMGLSKLHLGLILLTLSSIILSTIYSLWICNRILFGNLKSQYIYKYKDLTKTELVVLIIILFFILLLGIFPNIILLTGSFFNFDIEFYINKLIELAKIFKK